MPPQRLESSRQAPRGSPVTPRMTTVVRRVTFASAVNSTVMSKTLAPSTTNGTSRGRSPTSVIERQRSPGSLSETAAGRITLVHTLASASSPARSLTVCAQPAPLRTEALDSMMLVAGATESGAPLHPAEASAIAARTASAAGRCDAVDALECRLEARTLAVVAKAEEAHVRDVRIADCPAHELGVDARPA